MHLLRNNFRPTLGESRHRLQDKLLTGSQHRQILQPVWRRVLLVKFAYSLKCMISSSFNQTFKIAVTMLRGFFSWRRYTIIQNRQRYQRAQVGLIMYFVPWCEYLTSKCIMPSMPLQAFLITSSPVIFAKLTAWPIGNPCRRLLHLLMRMWMVFGLPYTLLKWTLYEKETKRTGKVMIVMTSSISFSDSALPLGVLAFGWHKVPSRKASYSMFLIYVLYQYYVLRFV